MVSKRYNYPLQRGCNSFTLDIEVVHGHKVTEPRPNHYLQVGGCHCLQVQRVSLQFHAVVIEHVRFHGLPGARLVFDRAVEGDGLDVGGGDVEGKEVQDMSLEV